MKLKTETGLGFESDYSELERKCKCGGLFYVPYRLEKRECRDCGEVEPMDFKEDIGLKGDSVFLNGVNLSAERRKYETEKH